MKNFLKFGLLATVLVTLTFVSCKDNEDDGQTLSKKVTKIVGTNGDFTYTCYFDSDSKLTYGENNGGKRTFTYQYTDNQITETATYVSQYSGEAIYYTYYKLENDRITSIEDEEGIITCNYSADGYISSFIYDEDKTIFNVQNGTLSSISLEEEGAVSYKEEYTYNTTKNNLNVDLWFLILEDQPMFGLMGTKFDKLPASKTISNTNNGATVSYVGKYTYVYDGDYLTKIIFTIDDDEESETIVWEIFYE